MGDDFELQKQQNDMCVFRLLFAASRGNLQAVQNIVAAGDTDLDGRDYDKRSALHLACAEGHLDVVKYLVENRVQVNTKDRFNNAPVDDAIRHGHPTITDFLIANGADAPSNAYELELITASSTGDVDTVRRLLQNKVSANASDYDGRSALHLAAASHNHEIVRLLLSRGANPLKRDRWDGTPLHDAIRSGSRVGDDQVIKLLKSAMGDGLAPHPPFWQNGFLLAYMPFQLGMVLLHGLFARYDPAYANLGRYPMFQDVNVMVFIGFGFLMTFLRKHGYSSVGYTALIGCVVLQWHPLVGQFFANVFHGSWDYLTFSVGKLVTADFCAASVLITFGALLGKLSALQVLLLSIVEPIFYSINEEIGLQLGISDIGGTMVIHCFGAAFGLAVSYIITPKEAKGPSDNAAVYHSDLFAMVGTVFLWMYWPSFNAVMADGDLQNRAIVNTMLSLCASGVTAFMASKLLRGDNKLFMVDVQNATLAGGVAIGTCANMSINPAVAIAIGMSAGFMAVCGYVHAQPLLERYAGLHDTCGVMNLHGIPSILGAIYGAIAGKYSGFSGGHQFAYLLVTLGTSICTGAATGYILRYIGNTTTQFYNDAEEWEVPELEKPYYFDKRGENIHSGDNKIHISV